MVPEIHVITAPMEMIPTAGVRMIEIMIVTGTMTAAMDLTVIEIMDMMNASELLHAPTVMLERMIMVPDLLPMRRLIFVGDAVIHLTSHRIAKPHM